MVSTVKSSLSGCSYDMYVMDHNFDDPLDMSTSSNVHYYKFMRSMHTYGQLARSWNEAITLGFGSLDEPEHDYVVLLQGDTALKPTWWATVQPYMNLAYDPNNHPEVKANDVPNGIDGGCHFLQFGRGDEFLVLTPTAVKNVGLFDERFSGIVFHEFDYFQRARACMPGGTCVHDVHGQDMNRLYRPVEGEEKFEEIQNNVLELVPNGHERGGAERKAADVAHTGGLELLTRKFPDQDPKRPWTTGKCCSTGQPRLYTPFEFAVDQYAYADC